MIGRDHGPGKDTLTRYFPDAAFTNNVIAGGDASRYPRANRFPTLQEFRGQFAAPDAADYRLIEKSPWRGAGTDGRDLGADGRAIGHQSSVADHQRSNAAAARRGRRPAPAATSS